jgi:hypothetical protein
MKNPLHTDSSNSLATRPLVTRPCALLVHVLHHLTADPMVTVPGHLGYPHSGRYSASSREEEFP